MPMAAKWMQSKKYFTVKMFSCSVKPYLCEASHAVF